MTPRARALLALVVAGCGSGAAPDPSVVPIGSWPGQYAAATCARMFGCCDATERAISGYVDEADCRQNVSDQLSVTNQAVADGLVVYDAKAARLCIDEVNTAPCTSLYSDPRVVAPSCAGVTRGAGKLGAPCEDLDFVCESSNCVPGPGTCGPPRACPAACPAGQYCDEAAGGCTAAKPEGAACELGVECAAQLVCYLNLCAPPQPDGTACLSDDDCASGACLGIPGTGACGPPRPDGSACGSDSGCVSGTCVKRTANASGATCGPPLCDGV